MTVEDPGPRPEGHDPAAAGRLLRDLMMHNVRYRRIWQTYSRRTRSELGQAAIAEVIALHLWEQGERQDSDTALARQLKDRVSRALNGTSLSRETLTWFISAFRMDIGDEIRLWSAYSGQAEGAGVADTYRERRELFRRQRHRTVSLFERYLIDVHHNLAERRTLHTIRAVEDGVESYLFNHESTATSVTVLHGGQPGSQVTYGGGLIARDILLDRPLSRGQTTSMEYLTAFRPRDADCLEVRRAAFGRADNVDLAVTFAGEVPRSNWWCIWEDHLEGEPVEMTPVIPRDGSLRRYVPYIEETVVGFRWQW